MLRTAALLKKHNYKKVWLYDFKEASEERRVRNHRINPHWRYSVPPVRNAEFALSLKYIHDISGRLTIMRVLTAFSNGILAVAAATSCQSPIHLIIVRPSMVAP